MISIKTIRASLGLLLVLMACKSTSVTSDPVNETSLSNTEWQMEEIRFIQQNTPYYYKRGSARENNMNFDNDFIRFNFDGTGIYHQSDGTEYQLKWRFVDDQKTGIEYTLENFRDQKPVTVHWEQIQMTNKTIKYIEFYTLTNGTNSLANVTRTAK
jgi:hypothetical protein